MMTDMPRESDNEPDKSNSDKSKSDNEKDKMKHLLAIDYRVLHKEK